jgi:acyl-CoA synthetase (AMP-forming)/AMP-acid ligase II
MPDDVAEVLKQHPAIRDAAVVGLKDKRLGEVPVAAVELQPGVAQPGEGELKEFCGVRLKAYEVPTRILIVDKLPRAPSLKISNVDVKDLFCGEVRTTT